MVSGRFTEKFKDANYAITVDVHMNSDAPKGFEIVKLENDILTLEHPVFGDGLYQIHKGKKYEFVEFEHNGLYSKMISGKPEKYKALPFVKSN